MGTTHFDNMICDVDHTAIFILYTRLQSQHSFNALVRISYTERPVDLILVANFDLDCHRENWATTPKLHLIYSVNVRSSMATFLKFRVKHANSVSDWWCVESSIGKLIDWNYSAYPFHTCLIIETWENCWCHRFLQFFGIIFVFCFPLVSTCSFWIADEHFRRMIWDNVEVNGKQLYALQTLHCYNILYCLLSHTFALERCCRYCLSDRQIWLWTPKESFSDSQQK